jgi:hypothetical protein
MKIEIHKYHDIDHTEKYTIKIGEVIQVIPAKADIPQVIGLLKKLIKKLTRLI